MKTTTDTDERVAVIRDRQHKIIRVIELRSHQSVINVKCLGRRKVFGWVYATTKDTCFDQCVKCWATGKSHECVECGRDLADRDTNHDPCLETLARRRARAKL